jgi:HEAT repeat protein
MSKRRKFALGGTLAVAVLAACVWTLMGGCAVDTQITEPHRERDLKLEEIRAMLKSGDFTKKLEASKQIDKLPAEEKLRTLLELSADAEPATRILSVRKLKAIDEPRAKAALARLAKEDPDDTVRELAGTP